MRWWWCRRRCRMVHWPPFRHGWLAQELTCSHRAPSNPSGQMQCGTRAPLDAGRHTPAFRQGRAAHPALRRASQTALPYPAGQRHLNAPLPVSRQSPPCRHGRLWHESVRYSHVWPVNPELHRHWPSPIAPRKHLPNAQTIPGAYGESRPPPRPKPVERPPVPPGRGAHVCSGASCYVWEKFSGHVCRCMTVVVL